MSDVIEDEVLELDILSAIMSLYLVVDHLGGSRSKSYLKSLFKALSKPCCSVYLLPALYGTITDVSQEHTYWNQ